MKKTPYVFTSNIYRINSFVIKFECDTKTSSYLKHIRFRHIQMYEQNLAFYFCPVIRFQLISQKRTSLYETNNNQLLTILPYILTDFPPPNTSYHCLSDLMFLNRFKFCSQHVKFQFILYLYNFFKQSKVLGDLKRFITHTKRNYVNFFNDIMLSFCFTVMCECALLAKLFIYVIKMRAMV